MNQGKERLGLIILAGGLGTRMGCPKALLPWGIDPSTTLLSHMIQKGQTAGFKHIIVSVGPEDESQVIMESLPSLLLSKSVDIVYDEYPRCGPLGGLYSSLKAAAPLHVAHAYAVVAVDMPFIELSHYPDIARFDNCVDVVVPKHSNGTLEPIGGIYRTTILPVLSSILESGDEDVSLHHMIGKLESMSDYEVDTIDIPENARDLYNVNYQDEYVWARADYINSQRNVPIFSVVASKSKTGKTTVVAALVSALEARGIRVGLVKSDRHGFVMDHPNTDTDTVMQAGATAVAIAGPQETAVRLRTTEQTNLMELAQSLPVDLVFIETRSQGVFPIIEVVREDQELISDSLDRVATISLDGLEGDIPKLVERVIATI